MNAFKRFISIIPLWAYALVLVVIFVNTTYLIFRGRIPNVGATFKFENGYTIHDYIKSGSPLDRAGIRPGDTLVSINSIPVGKWEITPKVGDTLIAGILRNNQEVGMPLIVGSFLSIAPGFFWFMFIITILFSIGSLFLLYRKPHDKSVWLFFVCIQMFMVTVNSLYLNFKDPMAVFAITAFIASGCFLGPLLIHFHLLFPRRAKFFSHYKKLPLLIYIFGFLIFSGHAITYIYWVYTGSTSGQSKFIFDRVAVLWMTLTFFLALLIAIFQFRTIRDTLSRNQLRIVITGSFFGFLTPMAISLFYNYFGQLAGKYPHLIAISQGTGSMIMICFILIAIFRYRIWNIEVFIRKALLYLSATMVIILFYLFLLYLVDILTIDETKITRFVILAISVIIFLMLRDRLQRYIERIFHRETYDSVTVVADFEEKLAGIYHTDELKSRIVSGLDEIFHFKTFVFSLKKNEMIYEPAIILGHDHQIIDEKFEISREFERMLQKSKVFSPGELDKNPPVIEAISGELVIPLLREDQPYGFFICGPKKSEKTYSMQDIRVLSLIAKRVIALFQTAALYQKDLDRQLMLERERARISQDMHDDIGASLTRISLMSDLVRNMTDIREDARQWLGQISGTSRGVMEEMNQIIWALNPKNDNLEGLVTYVRRFAFEYLEPTTIECIFDLPEGMPDRALSVEVRRNVYLVAREALHNVVKHSGATKVQIAFVMNEHGFRFMIKDDGKGFEPDRMEFPGNGLVNMKKRMNDIGGEFVIRSKVGEGMEIELVVSLK